MTKKDYEKAALIVREHKKQAEHAKGYTDTATAIREAFVSLFRGDNPRFDVNRFREACQP